MNQFRIIPETETFIIVRIAHQSATLAAHLSQQRQPMFDQRFANAVFLMLRQILKPGPGRTSLLRRQKLLPAKRQYAPQPARQFPPPAK